MAPTSGPTSAASAVTTCRLDRRHPRSGNHDPDPRGGLSVRRRSCRRTKRPGCLRGSPHRNTSNPEEVVKDTLRSMLWPSSSGLRRLPTSDVRLVGMIQREDAQRPTGLVTDPHEPVYRVYQRSRLSHFLGLTTGYSAAWRH